MTSAARIARIAEAIPDRQERQIEILKDAYVHDEISLRELEKGVELALAAGDRLARYDRGTPAPSSLPGPAH